MCLRRRSCPTYESKHGTLILTVGAGKSGYNRSPLRALRRVDLEGADLTNATALLPVANAHTSGGFSQSGEDWHAYATYFYGLRNGSFLEMGGLDGAPLDSTPRQSH